MRSSYPLIYGWSDVPAIDLQTVLRFERHYDRINRKKMQENKIDNINNNEQPNRLTKLTSLVQRATPL